MALAIGGVVWGAIAAQQWRGSRWLFAADLALGVVSMVLYQFRRRWPLAVALLTTLISAVSASSVGAAILAYISLATRRRLAEIVPVSVCSVIAGQVYYVVQPAQEDPWYY